jgi:hypothetical protein
VRVKQRDAEAIIRAERPELRIIPEPLWNEVQERLLETKKQYVVATGGKLWGRAGRGSESRYLLSGLCVCGACEASIIAVGGKPSTAHRKAIYYYACSFRQNRGPTACVNGLRARMELADSVVKDAVRSSLLTREAVDHVVDVAAVRVAERRRDQPARRTRLEADLREARRERDNLIAAMAKGKPTDRAPESLLGYLRGLDARIVALEAELAEEALPVPTALELARLKRDLRTMLGEFDTLLAGDVPAARQVLRKLLDGPIRFDSSSGEYRLSGRTKVGALLANGYIAGVPRKGLEPPQCCHR